MKTAAVSLSDANIEKGGATIGVWVGIGIGIEKLRSISGNLRRLDIEPKHVFIIPEKRDLYVLDGEFRLKPISKPWGWPDVITVFMRSLTENWDGKLITHTPFLAR